MVYELIHKKEAKEGRLNLQNELEQRLFDEYMLNGDSTVSISKVKIQNWIKKLDVDKKTKQELLDDFRIITEDRLFKIFSIADAY